MSKMWTVSVNHNGRNRAVDRSTQASAGKKHTGKNIDGSSLGFAGGGNDRIAQRRKAAKEKAQRLVKEAWRKDQEADRSISAKQEKIAGKAEENAAWSSKLADLDRDRAALQEEYGIDPQSQEQKDLELLEKYQNRKQGGFGEAFSKEEIERLRELQTLPMTEYQKRVLTLNGVKNELKQIKAQNEQSMQRMEASVRDEQIAKLGSQNMSNAKEAGAAVEEAAGQEIINLLLQDSKEHMDQVAEEEQKRAEKEAEKKEEQDKRLEKQKEKQKEMKELIARDLDADEIEVNHKLQNQSNGQQRDVQRRIQKILKDNQLVDEDLKGIEIDFDF